MPLIAIAEFPDRIAADIARLDLLANGIGAVLFDEGMAGLGLGFMTPVRLMIDEQDAATARAVLGLPEK